MSESEDSVSTISPASSITSSPTVLPKSPRQKDVVVTAQRRPTLAHPSTAVMVITAIKTLNDKKGSTLQAIKKYLAIHYQVDSTKSAPYIRRYLKAAVAKGDLLQTNGTGANGKFKLPIEVKKPAVKKKKAVFAAVTKKKPDVKKSTAVVKAATSGKRKSVDATTTTLSNVKKSKKVTTTVVKPKPKTVKAAAKDSMAKTKKAESAAAIKSKTEKAVAKKAPAKKAAAPKNK